jgi:DNA-binding transcriptional MocR family regulator
MWSDPDDVSRRERVSAIYTLRREALRTALAEHGIESHGSSGLNVWIPVAHEDATVAALQSCGWGVLAGDRFRIASARGIRVTTARLDPADAVRFAADVEAALTPQPSRLS